MDCKKSQAANNEIIRLRASVRKARVGLVWKLTKQTKLLKNRKHGDEKTLQKCKRKCEKFIREIKAAKSLKDDDIIKFAILNTKSLEEVLADPNIERKTLVMTKLAFHKALKSAVEKFREKFPDYKLGKRQLANTKLTKSLGINPPKPENTEDEAAEADEAEGEDDNGPKSDEDNDNENTGENSDSDFENCDGKSEESNDSDENSENPKLDIHPLKPTPKNQETPQSPTPKPKSESKPKSKKSKNPKNVDEISPSELNSESDIPKTEFDSGPTKFAEDPPKSASKKSKKSESKEETSLPAPENSVRSTKADQATKKSKARKSSRPDPPTNPKIPPKRPQIKVVSNLASVKRLKIAEELEETDDFTEPSNAPSNERKIDLDTAEDSFFISSAPGGVYKSVIIPRPQPEVPEAPEEGTMDNRSGKWVSHRQKGPFKPTGHRQGAENFRKNPRSEQKDFGKKNRNLPGKWEGRDSRNKFENGDSGKKDGGENLHPSWVARKKQQEALKQGFQGKKIVFSDD